MIPRLIQRLTGFYIAGVILFACGALCFLAGVWVGALMAAGMVKAMVP